MASWHQKDLGQNRIPSNYRNEFSTSFIPSVSLYLLDPVLFPQPLNQVLVILTHVLEFKLQLRVEVIPQWWHCPYSLQALQVLQFKLQLQVEAIP